jgi:hypothetical protein
MPGQVDSSASAFIAHLPFGIKHQLRDLGMAKSLIEMAAEIVQTQVGRMRALTLVDQTADYAWKSQV